MLFAGIRVGTLVAIVSVPIIGSVTSAELTMLVSAAVAGTALTRSLVYLFLSVVENVSALTFKRVFLTGP